MAVSRRHFVEVGSLFAASVAVGADGIAQVVGRSFGPPVMANLLTMTLNTFKPLIGTVFLVHTPDSTTISVVLTSVKQSPATSIEPVTDTFTLSFRGPSMGNPLPQGTYLFQHPALGSFPLFIVPSRPGAPLSYSAVFNHLQP